MFLTRITVDNPVNTAVPGVYTVTYTVLDLSGNRASATRAVTVAAGGAGNAGGGGGGGGGNALWLLPLVSIGAALRWRRAASPQ